MIDVNLPLLGKSSELSGISGNFVDNEDDFNLPYTIGECITYRYSSNQNRFNFRENMSQSLELIHGKLSESEFVHDIERLSQKEFLNPPAFWKKFLVSFTFLMTVVVIGVILVLIWAMLILDLVFLAMAIYLMRKVIIIAWVWRVQYIEKSYFSKLAKELKILNEKYHKAGLSWTLGEYRKWLQLGDVTEHNVLGN